MTDVVAEGYDAVYRAWPSSPTFHQTWARHAVGGQSFEGFEHLSFARSDELQQIDAALNLRHGERLIDIACGAGGPGLWVARAAHAKLVGIDLSAVGLRLAMQRAGDRGIAGSGFAVSAATAVGLASACATGAMSIDSLQYVPDKRATFHEVARSCVRAVGSSSLRSNWTLNALPGCPC